MKPPYKITGKILKLTLICLISACGQQTEKVQEVLDSTVMLKDSELKFVNVTSREKIELNRESVLVIQFDSIEIIQAKMVDGEDNFYAALEDLMWYNTVLLEKMDSLGTPIIYSDKDTVDIYSKNFKQTIIKDSTFSFYTFFLFDGNKLERIELLELIAE